uniref:Uncharacterized protein n=1 Tax=Tectiviridae sp. cthzn51 TaxID=2826821 RepID=A0A8S5LUS7_9VIRU|nr:MAG TPA: hypothetical protein [Tectiviridae sp. cthzn51]
MKLIVSLIDKKTKETIEFPTDETFFKVAKYKGCELTIFEKITPCYSIVPEMFLHESISSNNIVYCKSGEYYSAKTSDKTMNYINQKECVKYINKHSFPSLVCLGDVYRIEKDGDFYRAIIYDYEGEYIGFIEEKTIENMVKIIYEIENNRMNNKPYMDLYNF